MRLYIMRHSQTDWNYQARVQGRSDIPLNERGISIAREAGKGMAEVVIDKCFVSPLKRAVQTAETVLYYNRAFKESGAVITPDERLTEMNFGVWEGRTVGESDEAAIKTEEFRAFFWSLEGENKPEGAETLKDVIERVDNFIDELCSDPDNRDKNIMLVAHGGTIKCILYRFYRDPSYFHEARVLHNCGVAIVDMNPDGELFLTEKERLYYDAEMINTKY